MAVYKEEKTGTWRVIYRYTDWTGEKKQTQKRGFQTKREAQAWEREQLNKARADLDMTFKSFVEQYTADMQTRIKENTWATKEHIIRSKLLPYFGKLKMSNITAQQIITWQNELMNYKDENGKALSPVYLKTINNQLSAIFNHAVKFYNLKENPCRKAGSMGKKKNREMLFWTKEEYLKFAEVMMDKPQFYYSFEMLYWCGIREGELLALTPADFDFKKGTATIYEKMEWIQRYQFRFRGISRERGQQQIMFFFLDEPQILLPKKDRERAELDDSDSNVRYIPYKEQSGIRISDDNIFHVAYPEKWGGHRIGISYGLREQRNKLFSGMTEYDLGIEGTAVQNPLIGYIPDRYEVEDELEQLLLMM